MVQETGQIDWTGAPELDVELLDVNEYSRPGTTLKQVNGIVIHYTANPGSSAMANRDYFEGLKDAHTTKASSHFIVGLEGEVVQCIPTTEIAYASNDRNGDTISIECCHPDDTGAFNTVTYQSMVQLTAWLCNRFGLTSQDVIRHYDVTGKSVRNILWNTKMPGNSLRQMYSSRLEFLHLKTEETNKKRIKKYRKRLQNRKNMLQ